MSLGRHVSLSSTSRSLARDEQIRIPASDAAMLLWKTALIEPQSGKDALAALEEVGVSVSPYARSLFTSSKFRTLQGATRLDFAKARVRDLWRGERAWPVSTQDVLSRVETLGDLCPPEACRVLRRICAKEDRFLIAMRPITSRAGDPSIFYLNRVQANELWVATSSAWPHYSLGPMDEIVYVLRPSASPLRRSY
jgi:hypothetical protein